MERFFSKVGVPFSINESPGYCPKLAVTWSICSQRSCLQNLATAFGLFLFSIFFVFTKSREITTFRQSFSRLYDEYCKIS